MLIREMKIEDYHQVYVLWEMVHLQLKKSDERAEILRMLERNPSTCLVGEEDGRLIAAVMGGFDGRRGMVHHLAVHPDYQGRGYGRLLMEDLEARWLKMGVMKVNLFVVSQNKDVLGFYEQLGYQERYELITMSKNLIEE